MEKVGLTSQQKNVIAKAIDEGKTGFNDLM